LIGDALSCWLIISRENHRPQNPLWISEQVPEVNSLASVRSLPKISAVDDKSDPSLYRIKFSDLDQNNHVNNVKYIQHILDSYPGDFLAKNKILTFEINYLSESSLDDQVGLKMTCIDQGEHIYQHTMIHTENGKEICRARINWEEHE